MLRVLVTEEGRPALPAIDVGDASFVIGSAADARIRLPAAAAQAQHVVVEGAHWRSGDRSGAIGRGHTFEIGSYRVRVAPAPPGSLASLPQRTESLARELLRGMLGANSAPSLTIERGPNAGAQRYLPPPDAAYVIGRGDDAQWIFDDPDLSKRHLEIRRSWDGTSAIDLGSKNGTRLDGHALTERELRDGMVLELGGVALRYRDPAEAHVAGRAAAGLPTPVTDPAARAPARASGRGPVFAIAIVVALGAAASLLWLVLS